ncbi:hypothetical protein DPMN_023722 [Dreissena polymorpha]|uniref:Uncharacterized protein n=1 Tax=Dreissena polymorpha TaxID=45954 RepID=A0A9D4LLN8_DREPO|nr:hypothetical protein DPMN_023722 [Dreissena polymorpha]
MHAHTFDNFDCYIPLSASTATSRYLQALLHPAIWKHCYIPLSGSTATSRYLQALLHPAICKQAPQKMSKSLEQGR